MVWLKNCWKNQFGEFLRVKFNWVLFHLQQRENFAGEIWKGKFPFLTLQIVPVDQKSLSFNSSTNATQFKVQIWKASPNASFLVSITFSLCQQQSHPIKNLNFKRGKSSHSNFIIFVFHSDQFDISMSRT